MRLVFLLGLLILSGCASVPSNIRLAEGTPQVSYQSYQQSWQQYQSQEVMWGGLIASVENKADHTLLEMVHLPLRNYGRPKTSEDSQGRFRVKVSGFLDPLVYQKGRSLTVKGELQGIEKGAVGEHEYSFPLIAASGYKLWKEIEEVEIMAVDHYYPYGYWPSRWYGYGYPHYPRPIIIKKTKSSSTVNSQVSSPVSQSGEHRDIK